MSSAVATFDSQSRVGLVRHATTLNTCARETAAKSASAVSVTPFFSAAARRFIARSERKAASSTEATVRGV